MIPRFQYHRGEPITLDLVASDTGSYNPVLLVVEMELKKAVDSKPPPSTAPVLGVFTVQWVAGYWRATLDTTGLPAGLYVVDAKFSLNSAAIQVTEPVLIWLKESVSG